MKNPLLMHGCMLLAILLASPTVLAGGLKGKVVAGDEFKKYFEELESSSGTEKVDFYWEVENGVLPIMPPVLELDKRVGIALFRKDGMVEAGFLPVHPEVNGAALVPSIVVAPPKTTFKFHNTDPFVHELYSKDLGKLFGPELQSSQQTRQVQFTNEGVYEIRCEMTPHLKGYVVIVPGVTAFKNPMADGTFLFDGIAAGDYIVKVYFDGKVVASGEATVVDSEKERDYASVELKLAPPAPEEEKKNEKAKEPPEAKVEEKVEEKGKGGKQGKKGGSD